MRSYGGDSILADETKQYKMSCLESVFTADVNDHNDSTATS